MSSPQGQSLEERLAAMSAQQQKASSTPPTPPKKGGGGPVKSNTNARQIAKDDDSIFLALKILLFSLLSPKKIGVALWKLYVIYAVVVLSIPLGFLIFNHIFRSELIVEEEIRWDLRIFHEGIKGVKYIGGETMEFIGVANEIVQPTNQVNYLRPRADNMDTPVNRTELREEERILLQIMNE